MTWVPGSPLTKLERSFFERPAVEVGREVLGSILVHRQGGRCLRARIVEAEAYVGPHDLASHSSKGRTQRTEVMFGPGGRAYVYLIYGMYEMLNIVASTLDDPQAVLIRAAEPLDGWEADLSGPGKLTRGLGITRALNGCDLTGETLFLLGDPGYRPRIATSRRIGVDYAKEWKDALLRFFDTRSAAVSRLPPPRASGTSRRPPAKRVTDPTG